MIHRTKTHTMVNRHLCYLVRRYYDYNYSRFSDYVDLYWKERYLLYVVEFWEGENKSKKFKTMKIRHYSNIDAVLVDLDEYVAEMKYLR